MFEATESGIIFHLANSIDVDAAAQAQATLRSRILRAIVGRGLLESFEAKEMLGYQHSGFSVDARVRIEAHDRAVLDRLLQYCARPSFSMERLRKAGRELVYRCAMQYSEPSSDKRSAKADELTLSPLELIDRIAALVPPPHRAAVTALAQTLPAQPTHPKRPVAAPGKVAPPKPKPAAPPRRPAHYLWAVLIARIFEVFPLLCPHWGAKCA